MSDEVKTPPPGWYADPEMVGTQRYWDGVQWTEHRAPASGKVSGQKTFPSEVLFAGGAGVAMVLGAVGPWINAGLFSVDGLDGDGVIVLIAAVVGLVALIGAANTKSSFGPIATTVLIAGLVGAGTAIYHIVDLYSSEEQLFGETVRIGNPGWGLWLSAGGSVAFAVAGVALFNAKDN